MRGRRPSPRAPRAPLDRVVQLRPERRTGKCRRSPQTFLLFSKFSVQFCFKVLHGSFYVASLLSCRTKRLKDCARRCSFLSSYVYCVFLLLLSFFVWCIVPVRRPAGPFEVPSLDARLTNPRGQSL